ncbi:hypothetical protein PR202_gb12799 [Eleusine coracana subsp. coracana]|uniref:NB-ARC domain-containing protein n=1 Tax=Eleusine coracana subsp. coracana TaxID=191504 RepID=A0AAV5ERD6_ELECO|nr:hypothetical protein QOZ80_7BG0594870 [Eleusine coracana subsp. coracana]GJN25017.1 hypothetical protein PR202_gb12799 [Eleusine coracana subsp. coracana]
MLQLLNRLREEMYRGHHKLDTYSCLAHNDQAANQQQAVSPSFTPSSFNPAKRFRFRNGGSSSSCEQDQIKEAVSSLDIAIRDTSELVVFLSRCPPLYQQPYCMYLLLNKCMFGRQMEMEQIMNFLLHEEACSAEYPAVLPIFGPGKVGKTTMIDHACNDDRVRNRFSKILCVSQDSIKDEKRIATLSDCDVIKHHNHTIQEERMLVIIELTGEIDEGTWRELYSDCKHHLASGSKIIVASRSETIARLGTTQALRVQFFAQKAYWYFFKVRTFGSTKTEDHPKLASIAMEIAREMRGCFFSAHVYSRLLKANFNAHFWSMALAIIKEFKQMNLFLFGSQFVDPWQVVEPVYIKKKSSEYLVIIDDYQTGSAQNPAQSGHPILSIQDLLFGTVRPQGKFKVLAWRSHLPPYYSYMLNCEVWRPQQGMASRKKRVQKIVS